MADPIPSQPELPPTADVVVIGGGVNGTSTAFQLANRGLSVVLVEQGQLGFGATGKSGALVRCHYANTAEAALTLESLRFFREWEELVGHGDCGFRAPGFLQVVPPEDEADLRANIAALQGIGVETELIDAKQAKEVEPLLRTDDLTVLGYEPNSGYADPNGTVYGFAEAAREFGAVIATFTTATRILTRDGRVSGVETDRGTIATETVVYAGGAWSNGLLMPLGVDLGLKPRRVQVVIFRWPEEVDTTRPHHVIIDRMTRAWMRPEGTNATVIGHESGASFRSPDDYDETADREYVAATRNALAHRMPVFEHATMRGGWAGMIMMSPDAHPIIGPIDEVPGLIVMTGDVGSSFKTGPATGVCLAELITEGKSKLVDLTPFRPSRFREGQFWQDPSAYAGHDEIATISR